MSSANTIEKSLYFAVNKLHNNFFGCSPSDIEPLSSHGSDRTILRLHRANSTSIGIINNHLDENRSFIAFAGHFRKFGINIPEIYNVSEDNTSYLMEDLGDTTLLKEIHQNGNAEFGEKESGLYKQVLEILPEFQVRAGNTVDYSFCYQFSEFAEENIRFDLDYFCKRFLKNFYPGNINEELLKTDFDFLVSKILELERSYFMYRDFQSRNIMIRDNKFYFLDFQSGRRGALLYDPASLLYDAKAEIPHQAREELIEHYLDVIKKYSGINSSQYKEYFWYFAIIRILQAMGAYGFLGIVKKKSRFLESIPYALNNIRFILDNRIEHKNFKHLRKLFSEIKYEKT